MGIISCGMTGRIFFDPPRANKSSIPWKKDKVENFFPPANILRKEDSVESFQWKPGRRRRHTGAGSPSVRQRRGEGSSGSPGTQEAPEKKVQRFGNLGKVQLSGNWGKFHLPTDSVPTPIVLQCNGEVAPGAKTYCDMH